MSYLCRHCNSFPMEDYVWWVSGEKKAHKLVVCDLWRKYDQRGEGTKQAFRTPRLVDADWHAFCQALHKGIEGEDWREFFDSYKEMSTAVGVEKSQEAQKAKALWKMKAANEAGEILRSRA